MKITNLKFIKTVIKWVLLTISYETFVVVITLTKTTRTVLLILLASYMIADGTVLYSECSSLEHENKKVIE